MLSSWAPDVCLLDISLPDIDGVELLARIRELPHLRDTPAIAVTGNAFAADRAWYVKAGFAECLCKPCEPSAVVAAVQTFARAKPAANR